MRRVPEVGFTSFIQGRAWCTNSYMIIDVRLDITQNNTSYFINNTILAIVEYILLLNPAQTQAKLNSSSGWIGPIFTSWLFDGPTTILSDKL